MQKVLVTGGAGYIGSHTIVDLIEKGYEVVSVDNFLRGTQAQLNRIEKITGVKIKNYEVDLCNLAALQKVFQQEENIQGIIHFAALRMVNESVQQPLLYYRNNTESLVNILHCVAEFQIKKFVFSSSCSVYGNPDNLPVIEQTPFKEAESPYAYTKQMGEKIIADVLKSGVPFHAIALRYFNPVGAHPSGLMGEVPHGTPNNLAQFITQTAIGKLSQLTVYGGDYPTRDGSAVRDYVHIMDIASAHRLALDFLQQPTINNALKTVNLGTGIGVTVLEAIEAFQKVSGIALNYTIGPRRMGDPAAVYADNALAKKMLGWLPAYSIEEMMLSAWKWEQELNSNLQ